jgi:hypothetical protein
MTTTLLLLVSLFTSATDDIAVRALAAGIEAGGHIATCTEGSDIRTSLGCIDGLDDIAVGEIAEELGL